MTARPPSTLRRHRLTRARGGFSLIELMVVVLILGILAAITLPMLMKSYKRAIVTRTKSDLQTISLALEAYKSDFGDYPRFDDGNATDATTAGYSADPLNVQEDRGARLICRALMAPAAASLASGATTSSVGFKASANEQAPDGADGPGFRIRPGAAGKVYGPYLQSEKFKLGNPGAPGGAWDSVYFTDATLLDSNGNPILYYPATPGKLTISGTTGNTTAAFAFNATTGAPIGFGNATATSLRAMYNGFDNNGYGEATPTHLFLNAYEFQYIMGDRDNNGYLDTDSSPAEQATTTQPYLLWTAGPTGVYGLQPAFTGTTASPGVRYKCDAVCNFDLPSDLRK
jgi:prepilin-type N-terminal cleavage/methylation domain-containing protein